MRFLVVLSLLASMASATVIITTSGAVAGAAAFVLGAKVLALKGVLIGSALRRGRSVEELGEVFLEASRKDMYDCAKLLICELNAKSQQELEVSNLNICCVHLKIISKSIFVA